MLKRVGERTPPCPGDKFTSERPATGCWPLAVCRPSTRIGFLMYSVYVIVCNDCYKPIYLRNNVKTSSVSLAATSVLAEIGFYPAVGRQFFDTIVIIRKCEAFWNLLHLVITMPEKHVMKKLLASVKHPQNIFTTDLIHHYHSHIFLWSSSE